MLKGIVRYRPTNLCVVYLEAQKIEVLHAHRQWRRWDIGVSEQFLIPAGESAFDHLQYLNLKPKGRTGSALLVLVSSLFYSVHREYYPLSMKDHLEDSINFDWQENLFQENDRTLHFHGPPIALGQHVSVPIFSIPRETYDKLHQGLNGMLFHTFAVAPSALSFSAQLPLAEGANDESEILARSLDDDHLEVHRFYRGDFLESAVVAKSSPNLKLFCESLKSLDNEEFEPHIHLICEPGECKPSDPAGPWKQMGFPIELHEVPEPLVTSWLRRLLNLDTVNTFGSEILLKPWQIPRIAIPLAALVFFFALYGAYQSYSTDRLSQTSNLLRVQINQLETRWKPIETLQTRISKFQEDQKTLSEFNSEDYHLLELLTLLTQITPEDTSLNYLSLRKGQLILRGESKSALKYLAELSKTDGLTDVKFASPVTRDPGTDQERFNLQLQLDMEKLRKGLDALPPEVPAAVENEVPDSKQPVADQKAIQSQPPQEDNGAVETPEESETAEDPPAEEVQQ